MRKRLNGGDSEGATASHSSVAGRSRALLQFAAVIVMVLCFHTIAACQILPLRYFTIKDGLPSNKIQGLFQDSRGYLWVATGNGLSKFDGVNFSSLNTTNGLSDNNIQKVVEPGGSPGALYVLTALGHVDFYDRGKVMHMRYNGHDEIPDIDDLGVDSSGVVWGSSQDGMYRLQGDSLLRFPLPFTPLYATYAPHLLQFRQDGAWIADGFHLHFCRRDEDNGFRNISTVKFPALIRSIRRVSSGSIFVAIEDKSLYELRGEQLIRRFSSTTSFVSDPAESKDGTLWFGAGKYLCALPREGPENESAIMYLTGDEHSRPNNANTFVDRENVLWIGTWSHGLAKLSALGVRSFPIEPIDNIPWAACEYGGRIWVRDRKGLLEIAPRADHSWNVVRHPVADLGGYALQFSYIDSRGSVWLHSKLQSVPLTRYDIAVKDSQSQLRRHAFPATQPLFRKFDMLGMYRDREDRLWCSLHDFGVAVLDPATLRIIATYSYGHGAPDNSVRAIFEDSKQRIWLGGYSSGLAIIDGRARLDGSSKLMTIADGLPDNRVRSFMEDHHGRIWIGTRYEGIVISDGSGFDRITMAKGLRSNAIWKMIEDEQGQVWVATDAGLESVNEQTHVVYPSNPEYLAGWTFACGEIGGKYRWFNNAGEVIVDEYRLSESNYPLTPIYITSFLLGGNNRLGDEPLEIPYAQAGFSVEYIGISLKDPGRIRYHTALIGNDHTPRSLQSSRVVSYGTLLPGRYTFSVSVANDEGRPGQKIASVSFRVLPPFWKTWYFYSLAFVLFGAISTLVIRGRFNRAIAIERLRTQIASDLHDQIGSNLGAISVMSDAAANQKEIPVHTREVVEEIGTTARETSWMMRDIVWLVNPENDKLDDLAQRMKDTARALLRSIDYSFDAPQDTLQGRMDLLFRKNVFLIYKECLHNILKHARAKNVAITLRVEGGSLYLRVVDDGVGFRCAEGMRGNGLHNQRKRAEQIKGNLTLESSEGAGCSMTLMVKIP